MALFGAARAVLIGEQRDESRFANPADRAGATARWHPVGAAFSTQARELDALLTTLPPRYGEVLLGLLDRLESSALFTDESCSFSHRDLQDSVQLWLDKASALLAAADHG